MLSAQEMASQNKPSTPTVYLEKLVSLRFVLLYSLFLFFSPNTHSHRHHIYRNQSNEVLAMFGVTKEWIDKELEKFEIYHKLLQTTDEEKRKKDMEILMPWLEKYAKRIEQESVENRGKRVQLMNDNNPKFILRNYLLQNAIAKAETGDYSEVTKLLELSRTPYAEQMPEIEKYTQRAGPEANGICLTCSS